MLEYGEGQTSLSEEEKEGLLIPSITTHGELNEFEQLNIEKAISWSMGKKFNQHRVLSEDFIQTLHQKMYGQVWGWAGIFRKSEKNIGVNWTNIHIELKYLLDDAHYWIDHHNFDPEEIAIRFKHRLVSIHCFPNGNGRHSRFMADIIMESIFKKQPFSWRYSNIIEPNEIRKKYIQALKKADHGDILPLISFATS